MEPVGLVIGYVGFTTALLQQVDDIAKAFDQVKDNSGQASNFNVEIRALKETLLVVRDLAEQQGTEEAKVQTLAILAAESRSLGALLGELQLRGSKLDSSSLWQRLSRTKVKQILERVKGHRETLDLLLSTSGFLSPNDNSDGTNQGEPSGPSANIITEWLGYPNFSERLEVLQDRYVTGTGTWLLENPLFQQWLKEPGKPLWCTGQAGIGKSVLCAMVISHLNEILRTEKTPVISVFFRFDDRTQEPRDILKSLIIQLLRYYHNMPDSLTRTYNKHISLSTTPSFGELWACLSSMISRFDRVFILFDALDEYHDGPEGFSSHFHNLLDLSNTSLFVTSRPISKSKTALEGFEVLQVRPADSDIEYYIQQRLSKSWIADKPELHDEIVRKVVKQSKGSFLIASLTIDQFLFQTSVKEVEGLLLTLPENVHDVYRSMIAKVLWKVPRPLDEVHRPLVDDNILGWDDQSILVLEMLLWLTYSLGPLTKPQLQAAVEIRLGSDDFDPAYQPLIEVVEEFCSSDIISIKPPGQRLSLVHYSLNEYLQRFLPSVMSHLSGPNDPDTFIAKKCLTSLRWNAFSRDIPSEPGELEGRLARYPILSYAARYWGEHAQRGVPQHLMDDIIALFDSSHNTMFTGLVMSTYEQHPSYYERAYQGMTGLHISAYFGLTKVVTRILNDKKVHPDVTTTGGWNALHWAARRGMTSMVSTLLSYSASTSERTKLDGWTALHLAAKEGHVDVVLELMRAKVDINAKDVNLRTPLYLATWGGHTEVVRHLLQFSADPSIPNAYGATALHCAAKRGHERIMFELLSTDIDVKVIDKSGVTALDEAIRKKNNRIISMLTNAGAETRRSINTLPTDSIVNDLNWEAYAVNNQRTARVQKGIQCTCHVLEKATGSHSSTSPPMIFRKTFSLSADTEGLVKKYFESERMILHRLRHPNVVAYLDFDEDPDQNSVLLYMEYCDLGDLETCHGRQLTRASDSGEEEDEDSEDGDDYGFYIEDASSTEETTALDSQSTWSLIAQLSMALAYLHYGLTVNFREDTWEASFESSWHNVIHRDIKPANIVVQSSESDARIFKLCDLGIAAEAGKGSGHNTTQYIGSQAFRPPEVSSGRRWSTKGDIWSLGATIRELKKLKDSMLEASIQRMVDKCSDRKQNNRPSSLEMLEEARNVLETNQLMDTLPISSRLHIQAVHGLLGGHKGGYLMQAFNLVAELLDDIVPFHNKLAKDRRKETIERLYVLWNDGVEQCFQQHLNDFSLHILVLLPLPPKARSKHIPTVINVTRVNAWWQRSRWTPLHLAVQEGNEEMVKDLLHNGADKVKEDIHGCTPGYYAKTFPSIAALLK